MALLTLTGSMKKLRPIILTALSLACASIASATPIQGLTVSVSPDGKQLVAGGATRTLLVMDPETLEMKDRKWIEVSITGLAFNKTGETLLVQDSSDAIYLFNTADWTKKAELSKRAAWTRSFESDKMAGYFRTTIYIHSMADGSELGQIEVPDGERVAALALNSDGSKLALLTQSQNDEEEPKVARADLPKDKKGPALEEFKQKNDGKTSRLLVFNTETGESVRDEKIFFETRNNSMMIYKGDDLVVVAYDNANARISPDGEIKIFELPNSFNYGIGVSPKGDLIMTGGLRKYSITKTDPLTSVTGEADKLPSWPEYWKGFGASPDGSQIYGSTSAYRVFKMDPSGKVMVSEPVK